MMRYVLAIAIALSAAGCSRCNAPEATTYSCQSIDAGAEGCAGGPTLQNVNADPGKTFPAGCTARLPFCNAAYGDTVQTCECNHFGAADGGLHWICPL